MPAARSSTRSAKARVSCASPGVRTSASGSPRASQRRCSLVEKPPRERPSAWPSCPPWRRPRAGGRGPWCCPASARAPRPRHCRRGRRTPPRTRPGRASARSGARPCSTSRTAPGPPASGRPRAPATRCRPGSAGSRVRAGPVARALAAAAARPAPIPHPSDRPKPRRSPATERQENSCDRRRCRSSTRPSAGPWRCPATDAYFRCWARYLFISNIVTFFLPKIGSSFSSARISRRSFGFWRSCFLM